MNHWKKLTKTQIREIIFDALDQNIDYSDRIVLGIPASHLDEKVFDKDVSLLNNAPFLSTLIQNPNHIGCHTLGSSLMEFKGTQEIERELLNLCAVDILECEEGQFDGYVAAGGTEANIEAIWIYRNYYLKEYDAKIDEIAIICTEDSHYSMPKAGNILNIDLISIDVDFETRKIKETDLKSKVNEAKMAGKKYFIVVVNMMTTMFGSVDDANTYITVLEENNLLFKVHVDGAFGGFIYPFSHVECNLCFKNPYISSFTLDAHKMVEAPYGTGIFLVRKGLIDYVYTDEAKYVEGPEVTISGSRSGANAVSVWMILMTYGPNGWYEKIHILNYRTSWLCEQLDSLKIRYFREDGSNIVALRSSDVPQESAQKFGLVPDDHSNSPNWYKIVMMSHVTVDELNEFVEDVAIRKKQSNEQIEKLYTNS